MFMKPVRKMLLRMSSDDGQTPIETLTREPKIGLLSKDLAPFMVVFTGQAFSLFGSRLVQFALVWWITSTTGQASTLAFAAIMAMVPQVVLGPFIGALVDRWNRRLVLIVSDAVVAMVVVALVLLYATGTIQIWYVFLSMFVRSIGGAFQWAAMQSTTSLMVPRQSLSRVSGMHQSLVGLANIVAPPLGAFLLDVIPIQSILIIDVATAVFAIGPLFLVRVPQPKRDDDQEARVINAILSDMREGARFVWDWKGLRMIMAISMLINFLMSPAFSLLPLVVTNHFHGGAPELAWFQTAMGIGMIVGGLVLGAWGGFRKRIVTAMSAIIVAGLFVTAFSLVPPDFYIVAVGCIFVFAMMNSIANGTFFATLQSIVPAEIQGRVFTLLMSLSGGMTPIGLAIAGPISDMLGIRVWFVVGGFAFIALGIASFFSTTIMNLEDEKVGNNEQDQPQTDVLT